MDVAVEPTNIEYRCEVLIWHKPDCNGRFFFIHSEGISYFLKVLFQSFCIQ